MGILALYAVPIHAIGISNSFVIENYADSGWVTHKVFLRDLPIFIILRLCLLPLQLISLSTAYFYVVLPVALN
jgi:intracellular septation protein A